MLNASDLGTALSDAVKKNNAAWFKELSNYLKKNTEFSVAWVGVNPTSGVSDPAVKATAKFVNLVIPPAPYLTLIDFGAIVQAGCAAGIVNIQGWQTTPVLFGIITPLILTPGMKADYKEEHAHKAKQIIQWIKSWVILAPFAGAHGAFVGSGMHISTK